MEENKNLEKGSLSVGIPSHIASFYLMSKIVKKTNEAKKELDKLLEQSDKKCIRICTRCITMTSDAKIDLELDNPNSDDNLYDVDGYKVIINKVLDSQMNYITISYGGLLSRGQFCVEADFCFYY